MGDVMIENYNNQMNVEKKTRKHEKLIITIDEFQLRSVVHQT